MRTLASPVPRARAPEPPGRSGAAAPRRAPPAGVPLGLHGVLQLQRTVGNGAVARALQGPGLRLPTPAVQRGGKMGKDTAETYLVLGEDVAEFQYVWKEDTAGGGLIEVHTALESERIGYASFKLRDVQQVAPPQANEPYSGEHVLGSRAGKVCHLTGIYNLSLTRNGPAHIYRGFADALMEKVEAKARARGAHLIYLEPAATPVRKDPNSNEKETKDPTGFYTRRGYALDAAATQHNRAYYGAELAGLNPSEADLATLNRAILGGMLSKAL